MSFSLGLCCCTCTFRHEISFQTFSLTLLFIVSFLYIYAIKWGKITPTTKDLPFTYLWQNIDYLTNL